MLKDITLGQYFPGDTVIHRLDPRIKIIAVFLYIIALFSASSLWGYLLSAVFALSVIGLSKTSLKMIIKGLKPIWFLLVFTSCINILFTPGEILYEIWILRITKEGLLVAASMAVRIMLLVSGTSLLTYTTSPILLTDAIESLLSPLKRFRVPVHELAMMMSIALRFIPTLIEETDKIMSAQKARGADFESGNLIRRAKALIPILIPLFVSAFRRADELATAMECRLYRGGEGRTRLRELKMGGRDYAAAAVTVVFVAAVLAVG